MDNLPPPTPTGFAMGLIPPRSATLVQSLGTFDSARKKRSRQGSNAPVGRDDLVLRGTPRTKRYLNLFQNTASEPTIKDVALKLHALAETTLILPPKGGEVMNAVSSELVADIKTLIAKLVDLKNIAQPEGETRPNPFGFELPSSTSVMAKLDALTELVKQTQQPRGETRPKGNTAEARPTPKSYALMASKHAVQANPPAKKTTTTRPSQSAGHKKQAPPNSNMITLAQTTKGGMAMSNHTVAAVTTHINSLLAARKIKLNNESKNPIRI